MTGVTDGVTFAVCGSQDLEREMSGVLDLQARLLSPDQEKNAAYLRWKYWANPAGGDSFVVLARVRDRIVAMRGFMGHRWHAGDGRPLTTLLAGDTVVSRPFEGTGLLRAMNRVACVESRRRGHRFLMNMGAGWAVRLQSLRSGWRQAARAAVLKRPPQICADRREEMSSSAGVNIMGLHVTLQAGLTDAAVAELTAIARRPRRPIAVAEGPSYWTWRLRNPLSHYEFLVAHASGQLAGAVVMARAWYEVPAVINAAHCLVRDETTLCCLLRAVSEAYAGSDVSLWANAFDAGEVSVARSLGFLPFAQPRGAAAMPPPAILLFSCGGDAAGEFVVDGMDLLDEDNWDFQMLASDAL